MTKPIEKTKSRPLIHHPSAVLDDFCCYDTTSESWCEFSDSLSEQLNQFELAHPEYIRVRFSDRGRMSR